MAKETAVQTAAKNSLASQPKTTTIGQVKRLIELPEVKGRFNEILGKRSPQFVASLISVVASNTNFDGVDPNSIIASAMIAATLDLPINPSLGYAYIIPYKGKTQKAQFQLGYKAFVELAERTGMYETINCCEVYEGDISMFDKFTGEITFNHDNNRKGKKIIGYMAYLKLSTGFRKYLYMTVEELIEHGKRYSKSFGNADGLWKTNPHSMYLKTVLKLLLSKWGMKSVELRLGLQSDQSVPKISDGNEIQYEYVDNPQTDEEPAQIAEVKTENFIDWESPIDVIAAIDAINTVEDFKVFYTQNKARLECFGGKEEAAIKSALASKEASFS